MATFYIDTDYKCHITNDGSMTPIETDFFDGKCVAFIEGYRFIPSGGTWTRLDGAIFTKGAAIPFVDYDILQEHQALYEEQQLEDMRNALNELGVSIDG